MAFGGPQAEPIPYFQYASQLSIRAFLDDCEETIEIILAHRRMRASRLAEI